MTAIIVPVVMAQTPNRHISNRGSDSPGFIVEPIPMPEVHAKRGAPAPSILPGDHCDLTDDECLARLARAVEKPDPARLDEVAVLIGRLAVALE